MSTDGFAEQTPATRPCRAVLPSPSSGNINQACRFLCNQMIRLAPLPSARAVVRERAQTSGASMNDRPPLSAIVSALRIREGAQAAFFSWQARMTAAAAAAHGFLSIEFMPVLGTGGEWQMMLQFRDGRSLAEWR